MPCRSRSVRLSGFLMILSANASIRATGRNWSLVNSNSNRSTYDDINITIIIIIIIVIKINERVVCSGSTAGRTADLFVAPHRERAGQVFRDGRKEMRVPVAEVTAGPQHSSQSGEGNAVHVLWRRKKKHLKSNCRVYNTVATVTLLERC